MWILVALFGVLVVAGAIGGGLGYLNSRSEKQLADIRETVNEFAEASDTADTKKMAALMCEEEADQFRADMEGTDAGSPIKPGKRRAVNIGEVSVDGDNATVEVTRPPAPSATFKLKREAHTWKLCNPA